MLLACLAKADMRRQVHKSSRREFRTSPRSYGSTPGRQGLTNHDFRICCDERISETAKKNLIAKKIICPEHTSQIEIRCSLFLNHSARNIEPVFVPMELRLAGKD